jgi:hypothetical protein
MVGHLQAFGKICLSSFQLEVFGLSILSHSTPVVVTAGGFVFGLYQMPCQCYK